MSEINFAILREDKRLYPKEGESLILKVFKHFTIGNAYKAGNRTKNNLALSTEINEFNHTVLCINSNDM